MMISRSKHRSTVEICADCGASDPSWASINRGLLLCAECCSVHRSMGRHISHVKSLRQGTWPPSLLAMIQACTAQNVNSIWEHSLLDTTAPKHLRKKPQPKDPLHPTKSEFILAKHLRLAYVLRARRDEPPAELGRQLHSAVRSFSLDTAMRLLAQGADPNYFNEEKGTSCLHVACRAGQPAQAELLAAWGAEPAARDAAGNMPADCARAGGHTELAERMTELVFEAPDRLVAFLTGARPERPERGTGATCAVPRVHLAHDAHEMTDVAKAARGKLQLLPNHLFEELVMDIYDEIDRRETEAIWQTSAMSCAGSERLGAAFLPVNPALSAPRNQGRQKLARLSAAEMRALLRDVLHDAARRQRLAALHPAGLSGPNPLTLAAHLRHLSQLSDDEPLYDSVASDDDYAALLPVDVHVSTLAPRAGETVSSTYNPSLPFEGPSGQPAQSTEAIDDLKKQLDSRDSTITELKNQLKNLQSIVEQLTKENSVLKTTSSADDDHSYNSQNSISLLDSTASNGTDQKQERGKSLETDPTRTEDTEVRQTMKGQRPVSMYETREGPKNNWQVTKHQLTTLSTLDRSLTESFLDGGVCTNAAECPRGPAQCAAVQRRAEAVTRGIQELWAAARDRDPALAVRGDNIRLAVRDLLMLFPQQSCGDAALESVLESLRAACADLSRACAAHSPLNEVRSAAYDLAKATKVLVTHFNVDDS